MDKENKMNKNKITEESQLKPDSSVSNEVFTIPNIISFLRIIIITPFVVNFLNENYIMASILIALSGLSDCFDGLLARKLNQVSELGKILDPIADKLTLLAVVICISIIMPVVIPVMAILLIKDLLMLIGGSKIIKAGITPPPAKWYGKLGTLMFYISICIIIFLKAAFQYENNTLTLTLLSVTTAVMIFALIMYYRVYAEIMKKIKNDSKENQKEKSL